MHRTTIGIAREVRLFLSSTFHDMQAERDYLVTHVYPEIEETLFELDIAFYDTDLRWGVPVPTIKKGGEDEEPVNSWEFCRREIDSSQPLFFAMLGDRYGSSVALSDMQPHERDLWGPERSMTELEIRHAYLDASPPQHDCRFFIRELDSSGVPDPDTQKRFFPIEGRINQRRLIHALYRANADLVRTYEPVIEGDQLVGLEPFGALFRNAVLDAVLTNPAYTGRASEPDPRAREGWAVLTGETRSALIEQLSSSISESQRDERQLRRFMDERLRWFEGREEEVDSLVSILSGSAHETGGVQFVQGPQGQGKTTLLAEVARRLEKLETAETPLRVIPHFVGATDRTSSEFDLLTRLIRLLDEAGLDVDPRSARVLARLSRQPVQTPETLKAALRVRLQSHRGPVRLVVIIDGLNQVAGGTNLDWLPFALSSQVRVLLSYATDAGTDELSRNLARRLPPEAFWTLAALHEDDVSKVAVSFLKSYGKELDAESLERVKALPLASNPLFLLAFLRKLRALRGPDVHEQTVAAIGSADQAYGSVQALFEEILSALEVYGEAETGLFLQCLSAARRGLSSRDLAEALAESLGEPAREASYRIRRGLRPYLLNRGRRTDYFHGLVRQAADRLYPPERPGDIHGLLATVLARSIQTTSNKGHATTEMIYHLFESGSWDEALTAVSDKTVLDTVVSPEGDLRQFVMDVARGYGLMVEAAEAGRANDLVESVLSLLQSDPYRGKGLNLPNVNAWLLYNADGRKLLRPLVEKGAQTDKPLSELPPQEADLARRCRGRLASLIRREGVLDGAEQLLDDLVGRRHPDPGPIRYVRRVFGRARRFALTEEALTVRRDADAPVNAYELGYVAKLRNDPVKASRLLRRSADLAFSIGDTIGAWISETAAAVALYRAGRLSPRRFRSIVKQALGVFRTEALSGDPAAERWISNALAHLFYSHVRDGNFEEGRRVYEQLVSDDWFAANGLGDTVLLHRARKEMLEQDFARAADLFAEVFAKQDFRLDPDNRYESLAEWSLDYGDCLEKTGRPDEAREIWTSAMELPTDAGNGIWQDKIRERLSAGA